MTRSSGFESDVPISAPGAASLASTPVLLSCAQTWRLTVGGRQREREDKEAGGGGGKKGYMQDKAKNGSPHFSR